MKLLFCPRCYDVFNLVAEEWRICRCEASGGQYNRDLVTATVGGKARIFGIGNPFFQADWPTLTEEERMEIRIKYKYQELHDCWWGEYPGDNQLFRIEDPTGPRLKIHIAGDELDPNVHVITIIDDRDYTIGGERTDIVVVPKGHLPQEELTGFLKWFNDFWDRGTPRQVATYIMYRAKYTPLRWFYKRPRCFKSCGSAANGGYHSVWCIRRWA